MYEQLRLEARDITAEEQAWVDAEESPTNSQIGVIVEAWIDLQSCRGIGMAVGPIPWTSVIAWGRFYGLDHDATILLKRVIRVVEYETGRADAAKHAETEAEIKRKAAA